MQHLDFDEDLNKLTYDYKGNRMLVIQPRENSLPGLKQPKLNVPANQRQEPFINITENSASDCLSAREKREIFSRNSTQNVDNLIKSMIDSKVMENFQM